MTGTLPPGTTLDHGSYTLERLLGRGAFGCTYLALDPKLDRRVAIKEYMPEQCAQRTTKLSIKAKEGEDAQKIFKWGLDAFLKEARILAKFHHPGIVHVITFFGDNGTAYLVMENEKGEDLGKKLSRGARFDEAQIMVLLQPILDGLSHVHAANVIHRDIKPSNIIVHPNGTGVLIDFGAARGQIRTATNLTGGGVSVTSLVSTGYSPIEQWSTDARMQGPWTDIYALGATLYHMVTGARPPAAPERIVDPDNDPLRPAVEFADRGFSRPFLEAIDWALTPRHTDRPQDIAEWRTAFDGAKFSTALAAVTPAAPAPAHPADAPTRLTNEDASPRAHREPTATPLPDAAAARPAKSPTAKIVAGLVAACLVGATVYVLRDPIFPPTSVPAPDEPLSPVASDQQRLEEATRQVTAGDWPGAVAAYRGIPDDSPLAAKASEGEREVLDGLISGIEAHIVRDELDRAKALHEQSAELFPDDTRLAALGASIERAISVHEAGQENLGLAEQDLAAGRYDDALRRYREIPAHSPLAPAARDAEGRVRDRMVEAIEAAMATGAMEEAARLQVRAAELFPGDEAVAKLGASVSTNMAQRAAHQERLELAGKYLQDGRWQAALSHYRAIPRDSALVAAARQGEARARAQITERIDALLAEGRLEEAASVHSQGAQAFPGNLRIASLGVTINKARQARAEDEDRLKRADEQLAAGQWREALAGYRAVTADGPLAGRALEGERRTRQHVIERVDALLAEQRLQEAQSVHARGIEAFPGDGDLTRLGASLDSALAARAANAGRLTRAEEALAKGEWQTALKQYRDVSPESPLSSSARQGEQRVLDALVEQLQTLTAAGRHEQADALHEQAATAFPDEARLVEVGKSIAASLAALTADEESIARADRHLDAGRWEAALRRYRAVAEDSRLAAPARRGEQRVREHVIQRLESLLATNRLEEGVRLHAQAAAAFPGDVRITAIGESAENALTARRADGGRIQRAEEHLEAGRWQAALDEYRAVSPNGPLTATARQGEQQVLDRLMKTLNAMLTANRLEDAAALQAHAAAAFTGERRLEELQATIDAALAAHRANEERIRRAGELRAAGRWQTALEAYRAVAPDSAVSASAREGEARIHDDVVEQLERLLAAGRLEEAATLHADGIGSFPRDPRLETLGSSMRTAIASAAENAQRIQRAGKLLSGGQWQDALAQYRAVPEDVAVSATARQGERRVRDHVVERLGADVAAKRFEQALALLERATAAFPGDREIASVRTSLDAAREAQPSGDAQLARIEGDLASGRWEKALDEYVSLSRDGVLGEQSTNASTRISTALLDLANARLSTMQTLLGQGKRDEVDGALRDLIRLHERGAELFPAARAIRISLPLDLADLAYRRLWLTSPEATSANRLLDGVLALEPTNEEARAQKERIVAWYAGQARIRIRRGQLAAAQNYLNSANIVLPGDRLAESVQRELQAARDAAARQRRPEPPPRVEPKPEPPPVIARPAPLPEPKPQPPVKLPQPPPATPARVATPAARPPIAPVAVPGPTRTTEPTLPPPEPEEKKPALNPKLPPP